MGANLPFDVIIDILVRLPVKPLLRFKCVSKDAFDLISDPRFIELHLRKSKDSCNAKPSIACLHNNNYRLSFIDDLDSLGSGPTDTNELPPFVHKRNFVVGSCNGLLCLSNYQGSSLCICNPSTGTFKEITFPRESLETNIYSHGLGYDCENDDYKIVQMEWLRGKNVLVYSLKQNLWSKRLSLANSTAFAGTFCTWSAVPFTNKRLHYVVRTRLNKLQVARFSLCSEQWEDQLPLPITPIRSIEYLTVLDGCLCLCLSKYSLMDIEEIFIQQQQQPRQQQLPRCDVTDIWIMKEYGIKESWTKLASVPYNPPSFGPIRVLPITYSKNKSKLMFSSCYGASLFWYDLSKKTFKEVQTIPVKKEDLSRVVPYARSLVSIP